MNAHEAGGMFDQIRRAFESSDAGLLRTLLERHPELKAKINEPIGPFDSPAVTCVRSREMLDVLLAAGADINAKSRWWAGGFGLLHLAEPSLAMYAVERGALVDVHAASRLGLLDRLRELIAADSSLINAPGGDGQTPLHFAGSVEIADFLLSKGANIDALDVDHESTPAQYMVRDRQEIVRLLVGRGCKTDVLMAAALGDGSLVRRHLDAEPECIRMRVMDEYFPKTNRKSGGTIYQWTLGWYVSPYEVAQNFRHEDVCALLMERSPDDVKLVSACWVGDEITVHSLLRESPDLVRRMRTSDRHHVAHAARNNNARALRVMLEAGFPVDCLGQHQATPLHWAAFHGNAEIIREILRYDPPLESTDADFNGTPLGWAIHGSEHGWNRLSGDYAASVEALLEAGCQIGDQKLAGSDAVKAVLERFGTKH